MHVREYITYICFLEEGRIMDVCSSIKRGMRATPGRMICDRLGKEPPHDRKEKAKQLSDGLGPHVTGT